MKKLIPAVLLSIAMATPLSAKAVLWEIPALFVIGFGTGTQYEKPVPYHLTDACKAQSIQVAGTNYSYSSYEHCLKK